MKEKIDLSHPYWHIRKLAEVYPEITNFSFSYYSYTPKTIRDDRYTFKLGRETLLEETLVLNILDSTPDLCELAFHSAVELEDGRTFHIPLIDMSSKSFSLLTKYNNYTDFFSEKRIKTVWFNSGRSYHGYGSELLSYSDWVAYMGRLLLINTPAVPDIVDPRWIGHRLMGGYSALRWTKKTTQYKNVPTLTEIEKALYPKNKY
ncbi:primase 1D-like protein [Pseudomonas oryzihabitans]|uniref:primase 1D-like protein n=1 Tax=Pseudomonas oryzihabitans TaxID=47885 RepID=UPI003F9950C7